MTNDAKLEQYQEIIDKLHQGLELSSEEKSIVETDSSFKDYQKEFGLINKAISHSVMEEKLSELNKLEEKYVADQPKKRAFGRRSYLLFAAASILLLLALFLFNTGDDSYDGQLLASGYLVDFPDPDNTRSGDKGDDPKKANDPYKIYREVDSNENTISYKKPINAFRELIKTDDNPKHKFYLGICLLRDSKWKEAEKIFENAQLKELRNYPVNYYLGLSKLGLEKTEEAIELFNNPSSDHFYYNKEAKEILEKLDGMRNR